MKLSYLILGVLLILFVSCKKDKLDGDYDWFVGTWNWIESHHYQGACDTTQGFTIIDPQTESTNFSIVFEEKGKIYFYENDIRGREKRVIPVSV